MFETFFVTFALATPVGMSLVLHFRTRRMQRLMNDHLHSDHEHLLATEDLMRRVTNLEQKR